MNLLPKWVLPPTIPSIYEHESFTALEMVAKVYGAMNELITEYNTFADSVNTKLDEFTAETERNNELFAIGLRQEFQDFIDAVDLKIAGLGNEITEIRDLLNSTIENMAEITIDAVNQAIADGRIVVGVEYNPETEEMNIIANGGVE